MYLFRRIHDFYVFLVPFGIVLGSFVPLLGVLMVNGGCLNDHNDHCSLQNSIPERGLMLFGRFLAPFGIPMGAHLGSFPHFLG